MGDGDGTKIAHLDVGGRHFTTYVKTLTKYPTSRLNTILKDTSPNVNGRYFIDGDADMFVHILNYLRRNQLNLPTDFKDHDRLLCEAQYLNIEPLVNEIRMRKRPTHTVLLCIIQSVNAITSSHFQSRGEFTLIPIGRVYGDYISFLQSQGYTMHKAREEIGRSVFEWAGEMHSKGYISNPAVTCDGTDVGTFRRQISPHNASFDAWEIWGK